MLTKHCGNLTERQYKGKEEEEEESDMSKAGGGRGFVPELQLPRRQVKNKLMAC